MAETKATHDEFGSLVDGYGNEFKIPSYSMKDLRDAVPLHCFERSALTGFSYIARDLFLLTANFYLFYTLVTPEYIPNWYVRVGLWSTYAFIQSLFATGIWVMAHECGHQAFSEYRILNDTTGWIIHSSMLVPYFSWKLSHKQHHAIHNNIQKDMQFVPKEREDYGKHTGKAEHSSWECTEDTPVATLLELLKQQILGWPAYLLANATGSKSGPGVNHFNPSSPLYNRGDRYLILLSDLGIGITVGGLWYLGYSCGWTNLFKWYIAPYIWLNHWLVAIAYLQHTDPMIPRYQPEEWTYVRGAAATIDREFGFIGRKLFHEIIETHVCHHAFPAIPFYHAREATKELRKVMGEHYKSDVADGALGFLKSMWRSTRWCQWVEPCEGAQGRAKGVLFYRNSNGHGVPPSTLQAKSTAISVGSPALLS